MAKKIHIHKGNNEEIPQGYFKLNKLTGEVIEDNKVIGTYKTIGNEIIITRTKALIDLTRCGKTLCKECGKEIKRGGWRYCDKCMAGGLDIF